ncbi:hypothetical protein LguiB_011290 [Lonicera macranthoides]
MEESSPCSILDGKITGIRFSLATRQEICIASNSDCPISHSSQLSNPFLGLPLEVGKCESCGTAEPGKCEGHFGYIELPIPVYHPSHVSELKRMLSLLCLKCLKLKNRKFQMKNIGVFERALSTCCEEASQVSVNENKKEDASYLELKVPSRSGLQPSWDFLDRYGFRYGDEYTRPLLPSEVMVMLKKIPAESRKKLAIKGYFPQDGYILQYLPVPPNCLSVPDVSDGISVMSSDLSISVLKKVLKQVEIIKSSRSGIPNFESHEIEANELQAAIAQYLQVRGTAKASRDADTRYGMMRKEPNDSSTKAWLEKMKTLFIRKASGFSSRSVITGDPYKGVGEIGLPFEIAQRITFEERVNEYNLMYLQKLVDEKLCLTYRDGSSTYSLREGSKGHTFLRPGQVVHRRIMDGDIVFINRPPTTHKHSLQALSVYVHDDHTVKINPLICGPLSADFDGDCVHLFYPQSLAAKAEVLELFSVEKQLLSSHSGNFNLQLATDSLLSLKLMFRNYFLSRAAAQQLALFVSNPLPEPALLKAKKPAPLWTALQLLQTCLPSGFDCYGERHSISNSQVLKIDFNRDVMPSIISDIVTSIFFGKGPNGVLSFFNSIQPMLMENLYSEGFSVGLEDFFIPKELQENIQTSIQDVSPLLHHLRSSYNELVELQLENHLKLVKMPATVFILKSSSMSDLIDSKSDSAINRVFQQIGFLGVQMSDKGKLYSSTLVGEMTSLFHRKYPFSSTYRTEEFGFVRSCLFHGLDPYQEMVHSISSREVMVRSSRGLTEPGTLFKNLMAILRDVVVCYDGTVRNVCSHSVIQFEYGVKTGIMPQSLFAAGEPVGVLAATAMSTPAYKAVLDSSPSSNSSWEMMKEILQCKVNFRNEPSDRRVILYLSDCQCGRKYCRENAAYLVKNHLKKVSLKDAAVEFLIEYKTQQIAYENSEIDAGLVGHVHLNKTLLKDSNISMEEVLEKCQDTVNSFLLKALGDPRVKSANIIWISPDTTTWIRNPSKSEKGELALDVVLEQAAVKKSGDAWRIVLDTCLPVIDLIDTKRSIPYAIKQVQELLGISCAFEQAVQRLSMVTKGVLKEHLILLGNSMTCSGNLIGFNMGGIKAVSKALNAQVPFTEATLFTPKRNFEKAAEKCHVDSLSSIVASCSWGKHVAIGTGSPFEILLDTREVELNQQGGIDIYNFLNLVRGGSEEETNSACLGVDIDNLYMEDEDLESGLSPEHNSSLGKPMFEDSAEFDFDLGDGNKNGGSIWEKGPSLTVESSGGWESMADKKQEGGWGVMESGNGTDQPGWNSWGKKDTENLETGSNNKVAKADETGWGKKAPEAAEAGWGKKAPEAAEAGWGKKATEAAEAEASWGKKAPETVEASWGKKAPETVEASWGNKAPEAAEPGWGKKALEATEAGGWGKEPSEAAEAVGWGKKAPEAAEAGGWGKKVPEAAEAGSRGKKSQEAGGWGKKSQEASESGGWGKKAPEASEAGGWGKKAQEASEVEGWGKKSQEAAETGGRGKKSQEAAEAGGWGKKSQEASKAGGWGKKAPEASEAGSWGNKAQEASEIEGWGKKAPEAAEAGGWGKKTERPDQRSSHDQSRSSWGKKGGDAAADETGGSWGKKDSSQVQVDRANKPSGGWSQEPSSTPTAWGATESGKGSDQTVAGGSWGSWGSKKAGSGVDEAGGGLVTVTGGAAEVGVVDHQSGAWGSGKKVDVGESGAGGGESGSGGWKKKEGWGANAPGEWKGRRNQPPGNKPGGRSNEGFTPTPMTATRQRLDLFTSDEQDVLLDMESIMQSIRRIMHQTGYKDGDPISAEDQSYIVENVFNYHPDKDAKMGSGIKHIMVNKHSNFQESRCFYIVSTDGREEDFSYRKCLENFVKGKYPDKAEAFMAKYFRKPQPRPGWNNNRDRTNTTTQEESGTPRSGGWNNNNASSPRAGGWNNSGSSPRAGWNNNNPSNEAEAPPQSGWGKDPPSANVTAEASQSSSGWSKGPVTEEASQPGSGWNREPEGTGTGTPSSGWNKEPEGTGTPNSGWN